MVRRNARGFTLVELLVVIGIIAVLISILLPSLTRAREAANRIKCLSNLRQIGLGFMFYGQEFGQYPTRTNMSQFYATWTAEMIHPSYPATFVWPLLDRTIFPRAATEADKQLWNKKFIQNLSVLECPSDAKDPSPLFNFWGDKNNYQVWGTSYWYNCRDNFAFPDTTPGSLMGKQFGRIKNSSMVILLGDPTMHAYGGNGDSSRRWLWHDRRKPYGNVLFADMHAARILFTWNQPSFLRGADYTFIAGQPNAPLAFPY